MDFSVIIPTYNDWGRLRKCLSALDPSLQTGVQYEVIVVDNAPEHHPPTWIQHLIWVQLLHEPRPGSYAARNRGAKLSKGRFLAFIDSDCIPAKDWLVKALGVFNIELCDMIGGRIEIFQEENGSKWSFMYDKNFAFPQSLNVSLGHSVTANFLIKKVFFEQLGGFDSGIKSGGDFEFSKRAVNNGGLLCYSHEVNVYHPARISLRLLFKKQRRFAAWGHINVRNKYGHSSLRIFLSQLVNGFGGIWHKSLKPDLWNERVVVFLISLGLYLYKLWWHLLISLRLINPHKIRE